LNSGKASFRLQKVIQEVDRIFFLFKNRDEVRRLDGPPRRPGPRSSPEGSANGVKPA